MISIETEFGITEVCNDGGMMVFGLGAFTVEAAQAVDKEVEVIDLTDLHDPASFATRLFDELDS
ncbi:MAG: hypothetical protein JWS12_853 [Candidatus Saccharibacteria bacterium]|nr:hypothetical protein [Candidatus Saccharibacteria bacterium]